MSCGMSRIKRNAKYYTDAKKQNFWCESCFAVLKPNDTIMLDDGCEIQKSRLDATKNDSLPEERFLNCHDCNAAVHEICALFNSRTAKRFDVFRCPKCMLVRRTVEPEKVREAAPQLPRCKMSDFMEQGLLKVLEQAYSKNAKETGVDISAVERAEGLCIRVLSHVKKKHAVRDEVRAAQQIEISLPSSEGRQL
jgi:E1A/CREB-binding protein